MRIIAGEWRGRPLKAPEGDTTRPTADRTRETLFSMLASRIGSFEDLRVADLFAGSGALALEALSRGAANATLVETDAAARKAIAANAARALETMKDDGRAVLILGANKAPGGLSTDDRIFFNWLYSHYNVVGHFEVEGDLYARQGAGWPVRVIAIAGREKSSRISPVAGTIQRVDNWNQVYDQYKQLLDTSGRPVRSAGAADAL